MTRTRTLAAVTVAACALLAGCSAAIPIPDVLADASAPIAVGGPTGPASVATSSPTGSAAAVLATLTVRGRAPMTGYSRDQFGAGWADVDGDGCDTRDEILARDAVSSTLGRRGCIADVAIVDPYSGATVAGRRAIDIDHMVALGNAWASGAGALSAETRQALANDPLNLTATSAHLNRQKGDADAATWLPPLRTEWCPYVARQVAVKATYRLSVTSAEHDRIADILTTCPRQLVPLAQDVTP